MRIDRNVFLLLDVDQKSKSYQKSCDFFKKFEISKKVKLRMNA